MVIGTTELNFDIIKTFASHPEDLPAYCDNTVPLWARHLDTVIKNQRYYMAINIRNLLTIPFKERQRMIETLVRGVTIKGVVTEFVCITDIIEACDKDLLLRVLEEYSKDETQFKKEK